MGACLTKSSSSSSSSSAAAADKAGNGKAAAVSARTAAAGGDEALKCPFAAAAAAAEGGDDLPPHPPLSHASSGGGGTRPRSALRHSDDGNAAGSAHGGAGAASEASAARSVRFAAEPSPGAAGARRRSVELVCSDSVSMKKIVDLFYARVLSDPSLAAFFDSVDMAKLKRHQVVLMELAFGGKELVLEDYPNFNLRRIHYRLIRDRGLDVSHWQRFFDHFATTLEELPEVPQSSRATALAAVAGTKAFFTPLTPEEEAAGGPVKAAA